MTETAPEHQDPAEPYETGTEVETDDQPDDVTTGGELNHTEEPVKLA